MSAGLDFAAGARWHICCQNDEHKQRTLDRISRLSQAQGYLCALLTPTGSLVSNIDIAENLWLSVCWHKPSRRAEVLPLARTLLAEFGLSADAIDQLLQARPAALSDEEKGAVVLVRAGVMHALLGSVVLLCEEDWFSSAQNDERSQFATAQRWLAPMPWLLVSDRYACQKPEAGWQDLNGTELCAPLVPG